MAIVSVLIVCEIGVTLAVYAQTLHINLGDNHATLHLETVAYLQHISVLRYIGTAGENDICGGFAYTR